MKNRYEFKIEDINEIKVISLSSDNYTTTYTRRLDKLFVVNYSADVERRHDNTLSVLCCRCGAWNTLDEYDESNFICGHCYNLHEETISETELIDTVLSFMNEEIFFEIELYINGKQIK